MSYFPDLTPHTYTSTDGRNVLNVGWLDEAHPFPQGATSADFHEALRLLCEKPIHLHRGYQACQFCPREVRRNQGPDIGNGQIRIMASDGAWYAAPTMIYHYVVEHD